MSHQFIQSICEQETKDFAPSGSFQHNAAALLFLSLMFAAYHNQSSNNYGPANSKSMITTMNVFISTY